MSGFFRNPSPQQLYRMPTIFKWYSYEIANYIPLCQHVRCFILIYADYIWLHLHVGWLNLQFRWYTPYFCWLCLFVTSKGKSNPETIDFPIQYGAFRFQSSLKPIHWQGFWSHSESFTSFQYLYLTPLLEYKIPFLDYDYISYFWIISGMYNPIRNQLELTPKTGPAQHGLSSIGRDQGVELAHGDSGRGTVIHLWRPEMPQLCRAYS